MTGLELGGAAVADDVPLAPLTTLRIGPVARRLITCTSTEQIVAALGTMKGAAMKLGQVMSFLDVGLVPEEHREDFQRKLGELRDKGLAD